MDNVKDYSYMALYALKEVDMMLESYRPLTASERFFMESEDGEDKAASGIVSKLKTAIAAIGKMIKAVLDFIKDKLVVLFADKDTKVKMEMIKAKIKENPALAKKKIDTIDLYKWAKEYAFMLNDTAKKMDIKELYYYNFKAARSSNNHIYNQMVETLKDFLPTLDTGVQNIFSPSMAIVKNGNVIFFDSETI